MTDIPPLSRLLDRRPLIFTALPLRDSRTGDPEHDRKILRNINARKEELARELKGIKRLNAVSVPELVEENHEGKPRYNSVYTRALSRGTADLLGRDAIVNKVVAHMESYDKFVDWISETSSMGIRNIVFVGGNTRHHRYPGPSVSEANVVAHKLSEKGVIGDVTIGNISIPERRDEAKRMLFKTFTGAKFFTTQVLFDSSMITDLLREYGKQCESAGLKPATLILSFAPLKGSADLNLLDFLGVDLPEKARDYIIEGGDASEAPMRSLLNALRVYGEVLRAVEGESISVPIGVNIEQLTKSNFSSSIRMIVEFERAIDSDTEAIAEQTKEIKMGE